MEEKREDFPKKEEEWPELKKSNKKSDILKKIREVEEKNLTKKEREGQ